MSKDAFMRPQEMYSSHNNKSMANRYAHSFKRTENTDRGVQKQLPPDQQQKYLQYLQQQNSQAHQKTLNKMPAGSRVYQPNRNAEQQKRQREEEQMRREQEQALKAQPTALRMQRQFQPSNRARMQEVQEQVSYERQQQAQSPFVQPFGASRQQQQRQEDLDWGAFAPEPQWGAQEESAWQEQQDGAADAMDVDQTMW
jgi:hypothetical protein